MPMREWDAKDLLERSPRSRTRVKGEEGKHRTYDNSKIHNSCRDFPAWSSSADSGGVAALEISYNARCRAERLEPDQVLLEVMYAAISQRDLLELLWSDQGFIPCGEASARVRAVGSAVTEFAAGDRVVPLLWGETGLCPGWEHQRRVAYGSATRQGFLQSQCVLPAAALHKFPEALSDAEASTLPLAGVTAWDALTNHGRLQEGDWVLCQAESGLAPFVIMFAKTLGANVIVVSADKPHLSQAEALGANQTVHAGPESDWGLQARELTGGRGVDIVIEAMGNLEQAYQAAANNARVVNVGTPNKSQPLDLRVMYEKNLSVSAMLAGNKESFVAMCEHIERHQLHPVIEEVFPFTFAKSAFTRLDSAFGKLCVHVNDPPNDSVSPQPSPK